MAWTRARPNQTVGRDTLLGASSSSSKVAHPSVQVRQCRARFGVQYGVHIFHAVHQAEQSDRLLGGHHELDAGAFRVHYRRSVRRVPCSAGAEHRVIFRCADRTLQAQISGAQAAPNKGSFASRGVITEGGAGVVVGPVDDCFPVVIYGLKAHNSHPRHDGYLLFPVDVTGRLARGNPLVAIVFEKKCLRGRGLSPAVEIRGGLSRGEIVGRRRGKSRVWILAKDLCGKKCLRGERVVPSGGGNWGEAGLRKSGRRRGREKPGFGIGETSQDRVLLCEEEKRSRGWGGAGQSARR